MTHPRSPQGETQALLNRTVDLFLPAAGGSEALLAEEVQRLAERSADATRQITALVRAIQTDTQSGQLVIHRATLSPRATPSAARPCASLSASRSSAAKLSRRPRPVTAMRSGVRTAVSRSAWPMVAVVQSMQGLSTMGKWAGGQPIRAIR